MKSLTAAFSLMTLATSLLAQSPDSKAARQERYALITLTKYCSGVESVSNSQPPRIFSQMVSGLGASSGWVEFSGREAWARAGRPQPLAMVWSDDDRVVRVVITSKDGGGDDQPYTDYCYRPDGRLARWRAVPELQIDCDPFLLHCALTLRTERLYPPTGQLTKPSAEPPTATVDTVNASNQVDIFLHAPHSERTSFSRAPMDWPEYLNVRDLPFQQLLNVRAK